MSTESQLFRIDSKTGESEAVAEIDFSRLGFQERRDIQERVVANPKILGEELLIIGKEFSGFDRTNERADVIAIDRYGKLVVIKLKRDDTGSDVHWQAIKYASYFNHASIEDIVTMLATYEKISEAAAEDRLKQHIDTDDLDILNNDQRIMLVSHRFAPEVTSAVLWLNQKAPTENLITCVQLTPYRDMETNSLYIHTSTIIPIPGTEDLTIRIGKTTENPNRSWTSGPVKKEDDITHFLREAAVATLSNLTNELIPEKKSRWAGLGGNHRYYHVWYSRPPWSNWGMSYQLMLFTHTESPQIEVIVSFECSKDLLKNRESFSENDIQALISMLEGLKIYEDLKINEDDRWISFGVTRKSDHMDNSLLESISYTLRGLIESITPLVEEIENTRNEQ